MTIEGYIILGIIIIVAIVLALAAMYYSEDILPYNTKSSTILLTKVGIAILAGIIVWASHAALNWYFTETATGRRSVVDQQSELNNGLPRTINVLNDDGKIIRTYTGIIDIEGSNDGYVLFDYNGKRYTYYDCSIESIADIPQ